MIHHNDDNDARGEPASPPMGRAGYELNMPEKIKPTGAKQFRHKCMTFATMFDPIGISRRVLCVGFAGAKKKCFRLGVRLLYIPQRTLQLCPPKMVCQEVKFSLETFASGSGAAIMSRTRYRRFLQIFLFVSEKLSFFHNNIVFCFTFA